MEPPWKEIPDIHRAFALPLGADIPDMHDEEQTDLVVDIDTSCGAVVNGTLDDDRVCLILHFNPSYPVVMDVILLQVALETRDSIG